MSRITALGVVVVGERDLDNCFNDGLSIRCLAVVYLCICCVTYSDGSYIM